MEKFGQHTGVGVPLRRNNVDTDQIIPAVYLKRVTRTGFEDALFAAWRGDPEFVLNQQAYANGSVLVAGADFGTGSSREHAVWALKDYGFRAVLSPRFADIFRGNSGKQGLLAAQVSQEDVELLWKVLETQPGTEVTVDLAAKQARCADVGASWRASTTSGSPSSTSRRSPRSSSTARPGVRGPSRPSTCLRSRSSPRAR
jgi:3-isopropylmalate/(R)-2-methylmalate dehydratase small subunit